jgi:hypothetical protein
MTNYIVMNNNRKKYLTMLDSLVDLGYQCFDELSPIDRIKLSVLLWMEASKNNEWDPLVSGDKKESLIPLLQLVLFSYSDSNQINALHDLSLELSEIICSYFKKEIDEVFEREIENRNNK